MTDAPAGSRRAGPAATRPTAGGAGGLARTRLLCILAGALGLVTLVLLVNPRSRAVHPGVPPLTERAAMLVPTPSPPTPAAGPAVRAAVNPAPLPLGPDATGRIRIPVTDPRPSRQPMDGVPLGWYVKEFTGRAVVEVVRDRGQAALRLSSERTSFALYRDVVVDLATTPQLTWSWKVTRLPHNGDVRSRATDDQAAQVYVIFPKWPAPLSHSDVLGYIWDSRAPVDTRVTSPKADNVRVIVLASGESSGAWRREERDVAADYAAAFGRKPPRVGKIALMIDSNDTRSDAESLFGELAFSPRR